MLKKRYKVWNIGLTKETDERVRQIAEKHKGCKIVNTSNYKGSKKGRKVKDTSKMRGRHPKSEFKKGHVNFHSDVSKMKDSLSVLKRYREGRKMGFQKRNTLGKCNKGKIISKETKVKLREWNINNPNRKFSNTKIEQKIAKELDKRKIYYQQNVSLCNIANVDFYLPEYRIVIECDGCFYHNCLIHYPNSHKEIRERDEKKSVKLQKDKYTIYRFWEHDINESPEKCLDQIELIK